MPVIPTIPMARAPEPTDIPAYPWRFRLGELVYVAGRPTQETFTVVGGELWMGGPHYKLYDRDGITWRIPQLHCSSKPITFRKG